MKQLIPFEYDGKEISVHMDTHGQPWWNAVEVGKALEHSNITMLVKRLDEDEKALNSIYPNGPEVWFINESGLYNLILGSRKKEAKAFKRWVTHSVLPAIRKTGKFDVHVKDPALQALITMSDQVKTLVIELDTTRQIADAAKAEASQSKDIALQVLHGQQWITIRQYVAIHDLTHQLPFGQLQKDYGRWLTGYCQETGLPVYENKSLEGWEEHTYAQWAIAQTLPGWLTRRSGQPLLHVIPQKESSTS